MHSCKHRAVSMCIARVQYPVRTIRISRQPFPTSKQDRTKYDFNHTAKNKLMRRTKVLTSSAAVALRIRWYLDSGAIRRIRFPLV